MSLRDQSRSPGLLSTTALATVERAINTALRSDPASADKLAVHAGRLLAIEVSLPPLAIYALIVEDGVELYHRSDATADVTVKGSPMDLASLLLNWNTRPGVIGGPVDISGNRELLQEMQQLARELHIDWGAILEPVTGSELAQQLDYSARRLFGWARQAAGRLSEQLADYVGNESGLTPGRRDVYEFGQDVDELRMDVDRLDARIQRLRAARSGTNDHGSTSD
ncbi:MAG: SCP2 sterol-binding domain-containing protein [Pseudomonadota bacterium]|nr:SCP2 sterol-binding domain-containing protein [Pseudomonadota bacterium]